MGLFKRRLQTSGLCRLDNCNNSERSSRRMIKTSEAPYQMLGKRTLSSILGFKELSCGHFWLSLLSECLSCCLYVFIVCSTRISWTGAIIGHEPNLLAMALSSGIAMMLLIFTFRTVHVNPALTISFLLTGRIPLLRALLYILVHCFGAVAAIAFLYSISIKGHAGSLGLDNPHDTLNSWQILIVEIVISFVVTLATYATCNYSSYASARRFTLEQMGQSSGLFNTSTTSNCDNVDGTMAAHHARNSVAPIVPYMPSTSIAFDEPNRGDLISVANNHTDQIANSNNANTITNNKPYLITNHYNQVYDQFSDVIMNSNRLMNKGDDIPNSIAKMNQHLQQQHQYSNDDFVHRPTSFQNQTMKNSTQLPPFNNTQNKGAFLLDTYNEDSSNYDYDNHRIYATQQLKSDNSSQVPILEEIMQDECQLLAPNGFSLHVTSGQALVIGLAYTLTSLSGIPASGASLNPARSFGPAFIMNRWDHQWIYWLGPILGAVIAGFFYEFVFNPTRRTSLCYRPKLFRFSAHDMAKFGLKSRLYQQQQQQQQQKPPTIPVFASTATYRPQIHHPHSNQSIHHSPTTTTMAAASSNQITNSSLLKSSRGPHLITTSTSVAHLQPSYPITKTFDQMNYLHENQKQQSSNNHHHHHDLHHQTANFDRSKSTAIINSQLNAKQQRQQSTTMNLPHRNNNNDDLVLNFDHSTKRPLDNNNNNDPMEQVVYDDPNIDNSSQHQHQQQFRAQPHNHSTQVNSIAASSSNRRSLIGSNIQQRMEFDLPSPMNSNNKHSASQHTVRNNRIQDFKQQQHISSFNTVNSGGNIMRPHSMVLNGLTSSQMHQQIMRGQFAVPINTTITNHQALQHGEELDEELYNVLSETHDDQLASCGQRPLSNEPDYSNNINGETTSDSSQRTSEMMGPIGSHSHNGPNSSDSRDSAMILSNNNSNNNNNNSNNNHLQSNLTRCFTQI